MATQIKQQRVLRPYKTLEGHIRYMIVREPREVPVTMKVVLTR